MWEIVFILERYNKVINSFYSVGWIPVQSSCLKWLHEWFIRSQLQVYKYVYFKTRTRTGWCIVHTSFTGTGIKLSKGIFLSSNCSSVGFHKHLDNFLTFFWKESINYQQSFVWKRSIWTLAKVEAQILQRQLKFSCLQRIPKSILIRGFHFFKFQNKWFQK